MLLAQTTKKTYLFYDEFVMFLRLTESKRK